MNLLERENRIVIFLVFFVVTCLIFPLGLEIFAQDYEKDQNEKELRLKNSIAEYGQRLVTIEDERRLLRANRENYIDLLERGLVGRQDHVSLVKLMQSIQESRSLNPISYDLVEESLPSSTSPLTEESSAGINLSILEVKIPMLHDLDMFMFLDDLKARTESVMFPFECSFVRAGDFSLRDDVKIKSRCKIALFSMRDPSSKLLTDSGN